MTQSPTAAELQFARDKPLSIALVLVTRYDNGMKAQMAKSRPGRPPTGRAVSAAERMRRFRARRKAAGLRPVVAWVPRARVPPASAPYSDHRLKDVRSLAMHTLIAAKIDRDPRLLAVPRRNLKRWRARSAGATPNCQIEWSDILKRPWPEIAAYLVDPGEHATRLRQSSPFAGILTVNERRRLYDALRA
jgi:hypothetical protein